MARKLSSLRSAHLLMWSSPLLLVVLVFTLTSNTSPRTTQTLNRPLTTTTTSTPTVMPTSPTTTTTITTTTTLLQKKLPAVIATRTPNKKKYSVVTGSSAGNVAPAPSVTVSTSVLSGSLSSAFAVADVPLRGPGLWTLATSYPIGAQLLCASRTVSVSRRVVIMTSQSCQLQLTSKNPEVSPTWQLTPIT
jgi:hypothetical protein